MSECTPKSVKLGRKVVYAPEMYELLRRFANCRDWERALNLRLRMTARELIARIDSEEASS